MTDLTKNRLALYGGSFDPFHLGHLIGAQDALEQCHLDQVVFIPCAQSPHKSSQTIAPARHRLGLIRAAIRGQPQFAVDDCEIRRNGPSYTIDTVRTYAQHHPRTSLFWLIGADQLLKLDTWEQFDQLRRLVTFIVLDRPGATARRRLRGLIYLPHPRLVAISSTEIRERLKKNLPIEHLVPSSVARYLQRHQLYL